MSDRRVILECTSGDGAEFIASTYGQNPETAFSFQLKAADGDPVTLYVEREDVQDLIDYLTRENYRYRAEWPYTEEDESTDPEEPF